MICYIDNIVNTIVIKGNHNSQPSTFNSQLVSTLNLSLLVLLVQEERSIVTVLPFPCECLAEAIYEYHLYVTIFL